MEDSKTKLALSILCDVIALSKKRCLSPIQGRLAYAGHENFIGRVIDGYSEEADDICLLSKEAASALCDVQSELNQSDLGLYIFDAYRPLRAVKDFACWYHSPVVNEYERTRHQIHYPHLQKTVLVEKGYAPDTTSRHNFGHAVDLTLIRLSDLSFLDMGACFDYFDEVSHETATIEQIGVDAYQNRQRLTCVMKKYGFIPYPYEYWHFDYQHIEVDEPLDICIDASLKGLNA